jgi:tyrosyl-tRNA synthetase
MCHGENSANSALETAKAIFEAGGIGDDIPTSEVAQSELEKGIPAYELFFTTQLAESKSEARKLIRGGGAKVNDSKIEDENMLIDMSLLLEKGLNCHQARKSTYFVTLD